MQVAIAGIWGWWTREMFLLTFRLNLKKRMNLKSFLMGTPVVTSVAGQRGVEPQGKHSFLSGAKLIKDRRSFAAG